MLMKINRFLFAFIIIAAGVALRMGPLHSLGSTLAWLTFYPSVMIVAVYGGFIAGMLATGLSCLAALYLWPLMAPAPFIDHPVDWLGMSVFVTTGLMISSVAEALLRAKARANKAEEEMRALFDLSALPKWVFSTESHRFLEVNEAAIRQYGYSRQEFLNMGVDTIRPKEDIPILNGILDSHQEGDWEGEVRHMKKDGTVIDVKIWSRSIKMYGPKARLAEALDITAQKLADVKMKEAKELAESAAKTKSEFLASMSHEIRTPMNGIIGLTRLAMETDLDPKQADYLRKIMTSSTALLNILNDILDFSKIDAGKLKMENIEFRLEDPLQNTLNLLMMRVEEKGLEMFCEVERDVPAAIKGDPHRLGQVLNNIVGNAVKFTEKGEIHLRVDIIERTAESCVLRFTVRDTGIGLSGDQADRLFAAFHQADGSISRKYGGTGLGLAISQKLVNLMGGDISVSSELGKGSSFVFTSRFGLVKSSGWKGDTAALQPMKTLVVDDSETSLDILKSLLESWKFKVTSCLSGMEGLRQVELADKAGIPFQLLLLDWKMPELTGLDLVRRIQEAASQGRLASPPIVVMVTAYNKDQLLKEAANTKLDAVVIKPITPSGLYNTIQGLQQPIMAKSIKGHLPEAGLRQSAEAIRGARILLVEDNEINQQVAFELLTKIGLKVVVASGGNEALKMVEGEVFDGILMDLQMPEMDGYQTTSLILANPKHRMIPIIAMSAAVMPEDKQKCFAVGMVDHVAKPMEPEMLVASLLKWVKPVKRVSVAPLPGASSDAEEFDLPGDQPGFDFPGAIKRIAGDKKLLCKLLHKFVDNYSSAGEHLDKLTRAGDKKGTLEFLHSLKGVSGLLGAVHVFRLTALLENDIRSGQYPVSFEELKNALDDAMRFISRSVKKPE